MSFKKATTAIAAVAALSAIYASVGASAKTPAIDITTTQPSVMAFNQKLDQGSVLVDYAYLPKKGYAVIYGAGEDGKPSGEVLGHTELEAGAHVRFKVKLEKQPASGAQLWVALYQDKDGKPGFDQKADASIWGTALPYENKIVVQ